MKDTLIQIKSDEEQKKMFQKYAKKFDMTLSQLMIHAAYFYINFFKEGCSCKDAGKVDNS